eukprot:3471851-Pleurochrysis_carterae.AAC.3
MQRCTRRARAVASTTEVARAASTSRLRRTHACRTKRSCARARAPALRCAERTALRRQPAGASRMHTAGTACMPEISIIMGTSAPPSLQLPSLFKVMNSSANVNGRLALRAIIFDAHDTISSALL